MAPFDGQSPSLCIWAPGKYLQQVVPSTIGPLAPFKTGLFKPLEVKTKLKWLAHSYWVLKMRSQRLKRNVLHAGFQHASVSDPVGVTTQSALQSVTWKWMIGADSPNAPVHWRKRAVWTSRSCFAWSRCFRLAGGSNTSSSNSTGAFKCCSKKPNAP